MAIQIGGMDVINNSKDIVNIRNVSASGSLAGGIVATENEAKAGSSNTQIMTPLRVKQAIDSLGGSMIKRVFRGVTVYSLYYRDNNSFDDRSPARVNFPNNVSVNLSKTFVTQGNLADVYMDDRGRYSQGSLGFTCAGSAYLASSTQITITAGTLRSQSTANTGRIQWEVIEFN